MCMSEEVVQRRRRWYHLKRFWPLFLITLLSCAASLFYLRHNPDHILVFDDSYISLKFASNFFKYNGITYDGTSYLTGATSPLHIILVALVGLYFKLETASLLVGIIFFILSSLLVYLWALEIYKERGIALLAGALISTSGWLVFDSLNGLETTTFIFFSLLTFYIFYIYEHRVLYIIPLFLSILTRPEGWFIACALFLWQVIQYVNHKDKRTLRCLATSLGIFILLIAPYFLISLYYTGSLLPSTALAKSIFFADIHLPLSRIWLLKRGLKFFYKELLYPLPLIIFPLILFSRKLILLPYLWFYFTIIHLFYFLFFPGATIQYWCRYQHIFIPLIIIAISAGAVELLKMCKRKTLAISMAVLVASSLIYNQSISFMKVEKIYSGEIESTKNILIDLAIWLKDNTPDDSLLAIHDIGVVGYFSDRKIIDLVGLTNLEVSRYYWDRNSKRVYSFSERKVIDYLKEKKPDYLVIFPEWDRYFNFFQFGNEKYFKQVYTSELLFPTELRYKVYKCNWLTL
jgi:arabinofuranosyltransferase